MSVPNYKMVIGLTGPIASGKSLATKAIHALLEDQEHVRSILLSDYLREIVRAEGKALNRDALRAAGNGLRKENGPGALAERMIDDLPDLDSGILVVDSIRNPGEIEMMRDAFGERVVIIATDADIESRIQRVLKRGREDDSTNIEEIVRHMEIEMERNPLFGFDLVGCRGKADIVSVGKESKQERIDEIQSELRRFMERRESREMKEVKRRA